MSKEVGAGGRIGIFLDSAVKYIFGNRRRCLPLTNGYEMSFPCLPQEN